jgi:hypothetical protein
MSYKPKNILDLPNELLVEILLFASCFEWPLKWVCKRFNQLYCNSYVGKLMLKNQQKVKDDLEAEFGNDNDKFDPNIREWIQKFQQKQKDNKCFINTITISSEEYIKLLEKSQEYAYFTISKVKCDYGRDEFRRIDIKINLDKDSCSLHPNMLKLLQIDILLDSAKVAYERLLKAYQDIIMKLGIVTSITHGKFVDLCCMYYNEEHPLKVAYFEWMIKTITLKYTEFCNFFKIGFKQRHWLPTCMNKDNNLYLFEIIAANKGFPTKKYFFLISHLISEPHKLAFLCAFSKRYFICEPWYHNDGTKICFEFLDRYINTLRTEDLVKTLSCKEAGWTIFKLICDVPCEYRVKTILCKEKGMFESYYIYDERTKYLSYKNYLRLLKDSDFKLYFMLLFKKLKNTNINLTRFWGHKFKYCFIEDKLDAMQVFCRIFGDTSNTKNKQVAKYFSCLARFTNILYYEYSNKPEFLTFRPVLEAHLDFFDSTKSDAEIKQAMIDFTKELKKFKYLKFALFLPEIMENLEKVIKLMEVKDNPAKFDDSKVLCYKPMSSSFFMPIVIRKTNNIKDQDIKEPPKPVGRRL